MTMPMTRLKMITTIHPDARWETQEPPLSPLLPTFQAHTWVPCQGNKLIYISQWSYTRSRGILKVRATHWHAPEMIQWCTQRILRKLYIIMSPVLLPQYKAMTFLILKQRDSRHGRTNEITETRRSVSCWLHMFDCQLDLRVNFTYN